MPAICFRCARLSAQDPGDPFGACLQCGSFACITCGVREAKVSKFYCVLCQPAITLLASAGLPPLTGGADPPDGGGGGGAIAGLGAVYTSTEEFETLQPGLAQSCDAQRDYYRMLID